MAPSKQRSVRRPRKPSAARKDHTRRLSEQKRLRNTPGLLPGPSDDSNSAPSRLPRSALQATLISTQDELAVAQSSIVAKDKQLALLEESAGAAVDHIEEQQHAIHDAENQAREYHRLYHNARTRERRFKASRDAARDAASQRIQALQGEFAQLHACYQQLEVCFADKSEALSEARTSLSEDAARSKTSQPELRTALDTLANTRAQLALTRTEWDSALASSASRTAKLDAALDHLDASQDDIKQLSAMLDDSRGCYHQELAGHKGTVTAVDFHPTEPICTCLIPRHRHTNAQARCLVLTGSKDGTMLLGEIEPSVKV
ncbi:hypothetical protein PsYK624_035000 [Phanerochaete sordida]|uniref:Uncharacterized protein n=1 Tax=Phanerochaete sordida TaxID=48140 RepID=A0A9P3LB30_9APHY|nr:hypothetical protein PsYK624_035000 [Phanerochaete sordida]